MKIRVYISRRINYHLLGGRLDQMICSRAYEQELKRCSLCHVLFTPDIKGEISVFEHNWFCCKQHRKEYADGQTKNVLP